MRPVEEIDRELSLVSLVRSLYGGSTTVTDELLDERW